MKNKLIICVLLIFILLMTSTFSAQSMIIENQEKTYNVKSSTNYNSDYDNRYALIMIGKAYRDGGSDYKSFTKQLEMMYETLTDYYGFEDEDIQILFREQDQYEPDDPDFIDYVLSRDNTYDSTEDSLIERLNNVKNKIGDGDLFLFNYIGHGGFDDYSREEQDHSYLYCFSGRILDTELSEYTEGISGFNLFIISACHSGGFIDDLSCENRIVMTLTTAFKVGPIDWMEHVCDALQGYGDNFEPKHYNGYGNKNGFIDIDEVFRYPYMTTNLIDDNADSEGHNWMDDGYDQHIVGQDGNISASTTLGEMNLFVHGDCLTTEIRPGDEVEFKSWAVGGCGAPYNYHWDFDDGETSTEQNPKHTFNDFGTYNIVLTATDSNGNVDTYEKTISIDKKTDIKADGIIYFENVDEKIGDYLQGSFTFENVGDQGSELDWSLEAPTVNSYTITFSQENGNNLKPSDGKITIDYEIVVKTHSCTYLNDDVKIVDVNNNDEYEEVSILLVDGESELDIVNNNLPNGNEKFDPGAEISRSFTVKNKNPSMTFLEWEIQSWPDWGEWSFSSLSGEDNAEIEVTFVLPADKKDSFSGKIRVANKNNADDYKDITIALTTSNAKIFNSFIFEKLIFNHPFVFRLFQLFKI